MQTLKLKSILNDTCEAGIDRGENNRFVLWFGSQAEREAAIRSNPFAYIRWVGKRRDGLLCLDVDLSTGQLFNCSLILPSQTSPIVNQADGDVRVTTGVPVFDVEPLLGNVSGKVASGRMIIDIEEDFSVVEANRDITIFLSNEPLTVQVQCSRNVTIGFAREGELTSIAFCN
jgi:hypothetical protein